MQGIYVEDFVHCAQERLMRVADRVGIGLARHIGVRIPGDDHERDRIRGRVAAFALVPP